MLRLYQQIYTGKSIADDDRALIQNRLELYGLIRAEENMLHVRNEIYRHVFNADWINALVLNTPQSGFTRFTDWRNALTMPQRQLAMAAIIIALLAIVGTLFYNRAPAVEQPIADQPATPTEQGIVTPAVARDQPQAADVSQAQPADYDQALQEVIKPAAGYAGFAAYPGVWMRRAITDPLASLGQSLFFDPILSGDGHISCATCHHPRYAMADGRLLPIGTGGYGLGPQRVFTATLVVNDASIPNPFAGWFMPRNSLSMINAALYPVHMWDGRIENAYEQDWAQQSDAELLRTIPLLVPLVNKNVMAGMTLGDQEPVAIVNRLLARLQNIPAYVALFQQAFALEDVPAAELITLQRLSQALFAFEQSLIFVEAPWDHYIEGQTDALTEQQKRGALLFFGKTKPAVNCAECHRGDHFSNFKMHNLLVPQVGPGAGHGESGQEDWGRGGETTEEADRCAFRTPSLRNVTLTAPYFHNGAFATLEAAIRHHQDAERSIQNYDVSANNIPPELQPVQPMETCLAAWRTHASVSAAELADSEMADLVEFLSSLTDPAATQLAYLIPTSVPSGLPLEPRPWELQKMVTDTVPAQLSVVQQIPPPNLAPLRELLAPEDEHGKGALFGANEQQAVALQHLGLLQDVLAKNDLAETKRHTEHVINILVGKGDKNYGDHNVDDLTQAPGDQVGIGNYLRQVQTQTASLLDTFENGPETKELWLQIEQIAVLSQEAQTLLHGTVDQAFPIFATSTAAEAKPLAQQLKAQLDALTTAIHTVVDEVQPFLDSTVTPTDTEPMQMGIHFAAPQQGAHVTSPFVVAMSPGGMIIEPAGKVHEGAGHFHILIDTDYVPPSALIPVDNNHHHFGQGQMTTTLDLAPGVYTLRLQFANGEHIALDGAQYQDTITVTRNRAVGDPRCALYCTAEWRNRPPGI